jgi:4-amino-4-deoxy-L-arabinose transferase-like glycosyltransferase
VRSKPITFRTAAAAVFVIALTVRLLHVRELSAAPVFDMRVGDSAVYDAWAREIAGGDVLGDEVFWYAPLYPYVLGAIYALVGDGGWAVRVVQALLGALTCVLLADAGRRLFGPSAGIVAGALLALYAPSIFYGALIHRPVLELFSLGVVVWHVSARPAGDAPVLWTLALGLASGVLVLARENALALLPVLLVWLVLERPSPKRARVVRAAVFLAGLTLTLAPVALRNRIVGGELHLTAANFGDNFYKGNNERADGSYAPLEPLRASPEFERADAVAIAERETGRTLTPREVSRYWTGRALAFIRAHPVD